MAPLPKLVWLARARARDLRRRATRWGGDQGARARAPDRRLGRRPLDRLGHRAAEPAATLDWDRRGARARRHRRRARCRSSCRGAPELRPARRAASSGSTRRLPVVVGGGRRAAGEPRRRARCARASPRARSARAARCADGRATRRSIRAVGSSATPLTPGRWVVGGAINNGGVVLQWAGEALAPDLGDHAEAELLALAERVAGGQRGADHAPVPALRSARRTGARCRAAPTSG